MSSFEFTDTASIYFYPTYASAQLTVVLMDADGNRVNLCNSDEVVDWFTSAGAKTVLLRVYDAGGQALSVYPMNDTPWARTANYSEASVTLANNDNYLEVPVYVKASGTDTPPKAQVIIIRRDVT
jgi:hypothetical protein